MEHITPTIMCDHLGIQPITLRRWCTTYKDYLSPAANPLPGTARRFTGRDLEVFRYVRSLRDQGVSVPNISEQLAGLTFAEIEHKATVEEADTTELASVDSLDGPHSIQTVVIALSSLQSQVNALQQARNEDRYSRLDTVTAIGLGIGIGLVFCAILIGLAWLYGG